MTPNPYNHDEKDDHRFTTTGDSMSQPWCKECDRPKPMPPEEDGPAYCKCEVAVPTQGETWSKDQQPLVSGDDDLVGEHIMRRLDQFEETWKKYREWAYSWQGRVDALRRRHDELEIQVRKLVHVLADATDITALQKLRDAGSGDREVGGNAKPPGGGATV